MSNAANPFGYIDQEHPIRKMCYPGRFSSYVSQNPWWKFLSIWEETQLQSSKAFY